MTLQKLMIINCMMLFIFSFYITFLLYDSNLKLTILLFSHPIIAPIICSSSLVLSILESEKDAQNN
jgi:hypothetical protein